MLTVLLATVWAFMAAEAQAQTGYVVPAQAQAASADASGAAAQQSPVYILNQPSVNSSNAYSSGLAGSNSNGVRIYSQPTTVVEASPINESRAESLRKSRIEAEAATERRIVEKLETSRIEDEQTRLNRLFGPGAVAPAPVVVQPAPTHQAPVQAVPVQMVPQPQPQPVVVQPVVIPQPNNSVVVTNPQASVVVAGQEQKDEKKKEQTEPDTYVGAMVGFPNYPSVRNVRPNAAIGVMGGVQFPERYAIEGFFTYSTYDIEDVTRYGYGYPTYNWVTHMDQYNVGGAVKYSLLRSRFTPVIGLAGSYTYRTFQDEQEFIGSGVGKTSHSFDVAPILGVDIKLSESFAIGADFRYYYNVFTRSDRQTQQSFAYRPNIKVKPIEELPYYILGVNVRFSF